MTSGPGGPIPDCEPAGPASTPTGDSDLSGRRWPEHTSRLTSARHIARLEARMAEVAAGFWTTALGVSREAVRTATGEFFRLYPGRPVVDNSGGSGFADCFWLYTAARLLDPQLVVESGVYRGQTTWLLRQACPQARLHAVDVALEALRFRDPSTHYHHGDWTELALERVDPDRALVFFDDHVSQARRLREAYDRGFRTLLFDDDLEAEALHATGVPPVPTIAMVLDDRLEPGERIEWLRHGRPHHYVVDPADTFGARALIRSRHVTPDLTPILRQRPQGGLSLVRLAR